MFLKRLKNKFFLLFLLLLLFAGCKKHQVNVYEKSFIIMGTFCDIKIVSENPHLAQRDIENFYSLLKSIESQFSFYDKNSRLSEINEKAKKQYVELSGDEIDLLKKSIYYSEITDGAFDITFYLLWQLWKKCEKENRLPTKREITAAKMNIGYKKILFSKDGRKIRFRNRRLSINFGGIAKMYALKKCYEFAKLNKIDNFLINLGGDILAIGHGKDGYGWIIGIQDPSNYDNVIDRINVVDKILLTSGIYQRYVEINGDKYHHIIDVNTGYPSQNFISLTVIYDVNEQNALPSIVLFLMGKEKALNVLSEKPNVLYIIFNQNGEIIKKL